MQHEHTSCLLAKSFQENNYCLPSLVSFTGAVVTPAGHPLMDRQVYYRLCCATGLH